MNQNQKKQTVPHNMKIIICSQPDFQYCAALYISKQGFWFVNGWMKGFHISRLITSSYYNSIDPERV